MNIEAMHSSKNFGLLSPIKLPFLFICNLLNDARVSPIWPWHLIRSITIMNVCLLNSWLIASEWVTNMFKYIILVFSSYKIKLLEGTKEILYLYLCPYHNICSHWNTDSKFCIYTWVIFENGANQPQLGSYLNFNINVRGFPWQQHLHFEQIIITFHH